VVAHNGPGARRVGRTARTPIWSWLVVAWTTVPGELTSVPPPSLEWRVRVASMACTFFSRNRSTAIAQEIGSPIQPGRQLNPWTVEHFFRYLEPRIDLPKPYRYEVSRLVAEMARAGLLHECSPAYHYAYTGIFGRAFWLTGSVREAQRSGFLFLAEAIGPALIIELYGALTIPITGYTSDGDVDTGSGLVLDETHVLTNKHVVEDMTVDDEIPSPLTTPCVWDHWHSQPENVRISRKVSHPTADIAVIELEQKGDTAQLNTLGGIAFRAPAWDDRAHVFGYPAVPTTNDIHLVHQSGEVVNPGVQSREGEQYFLYSSTTRPGNSGGPIVAQDGRVVGIVAHDISARPDVAPFYRGIPGDEVVRCLNEMDFGNLVRLEDWLL
jgi:S1-C subfamily serine protease